jgi:hypothetical protein
MRANWESVLVAHLHDREILATGDVLQTELHPDHDILIHHGILSRRPFSHSGRLIVLIGILTTSKEFVLSVLGHVNGMIGEAGGGQG